MGEPHGPSDAARSAALDGQCTLLGSPWKSPDQGGATSCSAGAGVPVSTLPSRRRSPLGTKRRLTKGFLDAVPRGIELRCEGHLERVEDPL
jgi:hypothetical protein